MKMTLAKKPLAIVVTALVLAFVAGCNRKSGTSPPPAGAA